MRSGSIARPVTRWEYKTLDYSDGGWFTQGTDLDVQLNELGDAEWELVGTIVATETGGTQTTKLIFKRPAG